MSTLPSMTDIGFFRNQSNYDHDVQLRTMRNKAADQYQQLISTNNYTIPISVDWSAEINLSSTEEIWYNGISVSDLHFFCKKYPNHAKHIFSQLKSLINPLEAFIDAAYLNAYVLYIPAYTEGYLNTELFEKLCARSSIEKYFIIIDSHAHLVVSEDIVRQHVTYHLQSISIFLSSSSRLSYEYRNQASSVQGIFWHIYCDKDSVVEGNNFLSSSGYAIYNVSLYLNSIDADASWNIGYRIKDKQHIVIDTRQYHIRAQGSSSIRIRGILYDFARSYYNGCIEINNSAYNTIATQEHKNILMSDQTYAWAKPSLQVDTHKVQCAHGTAIGKLDKEAIFYVTSRGVSNILAEQLLIESFFAEIGIQ